MSLHWSFLREGQNSLPWPSRPYAVQPLPIQSYLILYFPILFMEQAYKSSLSSANICGFCQPQDICTFYFLCLDCSFLPSSSNSSRIYPLDFSWRASSSGKIPLISPNRSSSPTIGSQNIFFIMILIISCTFTFIWVIWLIFISSHCHESSNLSIFDL